MGFILFYKRIFLVLYATNFILILHHGYVNWGGNDEIGGLLLITISVFSVNLYTHENLRKNTIRPVHISIETFLSYCRLIVNFGTGIYVAIPLTFLSPVNHAIWRPLIDLTQKNILPGYVFHIICFLLFLFELCYLSEIKELKERAFGELPATEQQ